MSTLSLLRTLTSRQCRSTSTKTTTTIPFSTTFPKPKTTITTSTYETNPLFQYRSFTSTTTIHATEPPSSSPPQNPVEIPPPSFQNYTEDVSTMTNTQLLDATTIPGFTTLIHSPPLKNSSITEPSTPRNALVGVVVSDKMQKTVNVAVDRYRMVPIYRKRKRYTRRFMAHDEVEECKEGDLVMIVPCQRLSKRKHYRVQKILKAKGVL